MALGSIRDVADAYAAGRVHRQRFIKPGSAVQAGDGSWADWAYAAGQPPYDSRIGPAGAFLPQVAVKNDAIWFPDIAAGMERRLSEMRIWNTSGGNDQLNVEFMLYDLVGYYPLIDGDSTDPQILDNTLTLPRYTDGEGVVCAIVNHVAPTAASAGTGMVQLSYTNSKGVSDRTVSMGLHQNGISRVIHRTNTGAAVLIPNVGIPLDGGDTGVRSVDSITFPTPPGGLICIYLFKPLAQIAQRGGFFGGNASCFTEKHLAFTGHMPLIPDGAHLGFFQLANGAGRTINNIFGQATFIWG